MRGTTRLLPCPLLLLLAQLAAAADENPAFAPVAGILQYRCAVSGCHTGPDPQRGMRLDPSQVLQQTVLVRSASNESLTRIVPGDPEHSLLYRKLLPKKEGNYPGRRMPYGEDPLSPEEVTLVRRWIESMPAAEEGTGATLQPFISLPRTFHDSHLVNLPTPDALGDGKLQFRILHRFKGAALDTRGEGLYGLDSGAWISFALAYGLTERFEAGLRRTNLQTNYELHGKGVLVRQRANGSALSLAFRGAVSSARNEVFANRTRWSAQFILGRRLGERLSLMLAPTYVTHTNWEDSGDKSGTTAVGAGGELRLTSNMAITVEWVGQIAGVKAPYQSVSVGLSIATARHAFHIVATNTEGTHTDLYAPGGDLDPSRDFRLGFNISRLFRPD